MISDIGRLTGSVDRFAERDNTVSTILSDEPKLMIAANFFTAIAQSGVAEAAQEGINIVWVLTATFLIFFMQPGFALLEAGQVRAKNAANILMKNMTDLGVGLILYFVVGFGLSNVVAGLTSRGPLGLDTAYAYMSDPSAWVGWLFGAVFAMTAATIVSGATAERISYGAYVVYSFAVASVIYPVVQGLTWQGGLLAYNPDEDVYGFVAEAIGAGYLDFAGATVVHMLGGIAGLTAAAVLGARTDRFDDDGNSQPIPGHSIVFAVLGTLILAFGWYGFNVGTQATVINAKETGVDFFGPALGRVALNTTLAMAAGAMASAGATAYLTGKPDPLFTANGLLAGLVGITGACAHVTWWGALFIGGLVGALVYPTHQWVVRSLKVDDVCSVFTVHGSSGAVGTILIPFFGVVDGQWQFLGVDQLAVQVAGVGIIATWGVLATMAVFLGLRSLGRLRVSKSDEDDGLDRSEHGIMAYPEFASEELTGAGGIPTETTDDPFLGGDDSGSDQTTYRGEAYDADAQSDPFETVDEEGAEATWRGETFQAMTASQRHRLRRREQAIEGYRTTLIDHLNRKLTQLGEGDLSIESGLPDPEYDADELHSVHEAFEHMDEQILASADQMRGLIDQIQRQADTLRRTSEQVSTASGTVDGAADEIDGMTSQIASMTNVLAERSQAARTDINNLSASIEEANAATNQIRQQSRQAIEFTEEGQEHVDGAVSEMTRAVEASERTADSLEHLSGKVAEIEEMNDLIKEIVNETQMLALNANIESSRAGQAGSAGFEVIADNIKDLADDAKDSSERIDETVAEIQAEMDGVLELVDTTADEVESGADAVERMSESFEQIRQQIDNNDAAIDEITHATSDQADTVVAVESLIEQVADIGEDVDDLATEISQTTTRQTESTDRLATAADDLADLTEGVQSDVKQFTVAD